MKNAICKIIYSICFVIFLLTFSLAMPIYSRSFYTAQIEPLKIEETSGFSKSTIKKAYSDIMDFLTLHKPYATGELQSSEDGKAHFEDCQKLFDLNLGLLCCSFAVIAVLLILEKCKIVSLKTKKGMHVSFFGAIIAVALPLLIGGLCAINFEKAFEIFHKIFFPGKDNWIFSSDTDPIIDILPMEYFRNCAILIGGVLLLLAATTITVTSICYKKQNKKQKA